MTEEQRQDALALCESILETAAKLQGELREAKLLIEEAIEVAEIVPAVQE